MGAERPIPGTHACAGSGASEAKPNEWSGRARASDEVHPYQLISLLVVFADIFVACNEVHHYQVICFVRVVAKIFVVFTVYNFEVHPFLVHPFD